MADARQRVEAMRRELLTSAESATMRNMLADVFNQRVAVAGHEMEAHVERERRTARPDLSMQRQAIAQDDAIRVLAPHAPQADAQAVLDGINAQDAAQGPQPMGTTGVQNQMMEAIGLSPFDPEAGDTSATPEDEYDQSGERIAPRSSDDQSGSVEAGDQFGDGDEIAPPRTLPGPFDATIIPASHQGLPNPSDSAAMRRQYGVKFRMGTVLFPQRTDRPRGGPGDGMASGEYNSEWPQMWSAQNPIDLEYTMSAAAATEMIRHAKKNGMPNAARHLEHYIGNTGTPLKINLGKMYWDNEIFRDQVNENLNRLHDTAWRIYSNHFYGKTISFTLQSGWGNAEPSGGDWHYAVGGASISASTVYTFSPGRDGISVTIDRRIDLYNRYNWDYMVSKKPGDAGKLVPKVAHIRLPNGRRILWSDEHFGRMNRLGTARDYDMYGSWRPPSKTIMMPFRRPKA